jgi:uncharacterized protein (UPF0333 family)
MLQYLNQKRGQSTLEYAVLIVVIIGALLTIQVYIKRGVQGRLKSAADDIGDQYSDGNTNEIKTTVRVSNSEETFGIQGQGVSVSKLIAPEVTNTTENTILVNSQQEYWGTST